MCHLSEFNREFRNENVEQVYIDILAKELDDTKGVSDC